MKIRQRATRLSVRLQALMRDFDRNRLQDQFSDWPALNGGPRETFISSARSRLKALVRQEGQ